MSWLLVLALPFLALVVQDLWLMRRRTRRLGGTLDFTGHRWKDSS